MHLEHLGYEWESLKNKALFQLTEGGGYNNIHMLDTLRAMQTLYLQIATARDAFCHTVSPCGLAQAGE